MSEIHFDVNLISKINYRKSYHILKYEWKFEQTVPKYKRILGIFKVRNGIEVKPAGFYEERTNYYCDGKLYIHVTEEELILWGYQIKDAPYPSDDKQVWTKSYVEVSLGYKSSVGKSFDTDQEALDWIEKLKQLSGKTFEVIIN